MSDAHADDMEEETGAENTPVESKKVIDFFPSIVRSLNEDDLKSPAVLKMLISENEKYNRELSRLQNIDIKFHECDKSLSVALEKVKQKTSSEIFSDFVYAVGGVILAISTFDFSKPFEIKNWLFILIGFVLILGAAISKWSKK